MLLIKKGFSEAVYPAVLLFLVTVCANSADLAFSLGIKRGMLAKVSIQSKLPHPTPVCGNRAEEVLLSH